MCTEDPEQDSPYREANDSIEQLLASGIQHGMDAKKLCVVIRKPDGSGSRMEAEHLCIKPQQHQEVKSRWLGRVRWAGRLFRDCIRAVVVELIARKFVN